MQRIREMIEQSVSGMGYEPVDVEFTSSGLLRVYIDLLDKDVSDARPVIAIEDCEQVSRQLSHLLTVEDVNYERLEVSSPGLDRPLRTPGHFQRFVGEQVKIKLRELFNGRKQYSGLLTDEEDGRFGLELMEDPPQDLGKGHRNPKGRVAPQLTGEKLVFELDELEMARLVPQIDFRRQA